VLSLLKRYKDLLFVSGLLLYPFVTYLATKSQPRAPHLLDRAVIAMSSPLQAALTWVIDGIGGGWSGYVGLRGVRADNLVLKDENARLRAELNVLTEARAENERLKRLLAYTENVTVGQPIAARVVGVNPVQNMLSVHINRGEKDGVHKGMPVVTADGVVGQVLRATAGWADVLLITDPNSRLGVRVQRSPRYRATAVGARDKTGLPLVLENAPRTDDVLEGDVLVTSGTDGIFPPGLVVGRATGVEKKNFGMFLHAKIIPAVDVTALEEVVVLPESALPASTPGGLPK
jgi:rod shape-determining protein MreC